MFLWDKSICLQCGVPSYDKVEVSNKCRICGSNDMINVSKKDGKKLRKIRQMRTGNIDSLLDALEDYTKNIMHIKLADDFKERCKDCVRKRKEEEAARIKEIADRSSIYTPTFITCPYCHSTNVSKISTIDRGISVGMTGLASGKLGKQWHCNKCKSNF